MTKADEPRNAGPRRAVFLATDLSSGGGLNKVIRELSDLFEAHLGFAVTVVNARSDAAPSYPFSTSVEVQHHKGRGPLSYLRVLYRLRRSRPYVVIGPWAQDNVLLILAFLFSPTRVVVVEHTSWDFHTRFIRFMTRLAYPFAWRVVVLNPENEEYYRRYLKSVRLIPNPIVGSSNFRDQKREKLVLAVGHLLPVKNFKDAISAMAKSRLEDEGWSLVIIGAGEEEAELKALAIRLGLNSSRIEPPSSEIGSWYARASILVSTSLVEGFPLVVAEAMRAGVVPIASRTAGSAFILEHFPDHLVDICDVDALAERLTRFALADDLGPLRKQLAASIEARFSPLVIARRWRMLLSDPRS